MTALNHLLLGLVLAVVAVAPAQALVHSPDINGGYGDLQGLGSVDAVVNDSTSTAKGVFSDIYGHAVATVSGTTVTWNSVLSSGYGPQPGTPAQPLDGVHDLPTLLAWHGKYVDGTGYYYLGNRYYDPTSGTFLSCDPLGHGGSMDLYSYCQGDPVNFSDPNGLTQSKYTSQQFARDQDADEQMMAFESYRMRARLPSDPGVSPIPMWARAVVGMFGPSQQDLSVSPSQPLGSGPAHIASLYEIGIAKNIVDTIAIGNNPSRLFTGQMSLSQEMTTRSYSSKFTYQERSVADFNIGAASFFLPLQKIEGVSVGLRVIGQNRVLFNGIEVRAVRDLSHIDEGTLRAIKEYGFAPTTVNGDPIILHHLGQNPSGPLVEIPAPNHSIWNNIQHPLGNASGVGLTVEERAAYNTWRVEYWKARAAAELSKRGQ